MPAGDAAMTTRPTGLTHVQAPAVYPYPRDGEIDAWAEWQARIDATDKPPIDPAVAAQLRANDAVFRRYRAAMGEPR
jgi:hypothetical protein